MKQPMQSSWAWDTFGGRYTGCNPVEVGLAAERRIDELEAAITAIVQAADRVERIYDDGGLALAVDAAAELIQLTSRPPHPDRPRGS